MSPEEIKANGLKRSEQYAHFHENGETTNGNGHIDFHNEEGLDIFGLYPEETQKAEEFLRSGRVQVVIPARNEVQFGAYPGVLDYMSHLVGPEHMLVIDADSWDGTGEYARELGIETVKQSEVEEAYDTERIAEEFGLDLPLKAGKGRTMLAASIYQMCVQDKHRMMTGQGVAEYNLFSDADITNPHEFNHARWLGWVGAQYPEGTLAEVKAAQHDRNNQAVMNTMAMLQNDNPVMRRYFEETGELVWPLTGQFMKTPMVLRQVPNVVGYGTEMIANLAAGDIARKQGLKRAQVEIPERCVDGYNSTEKETAMMTGISTLLWLVNNHIFREGKSLMDMGPEDYRRLNAEIQHYENGFRISSIREGNHGPNIQIPITLDRFLPPAQYLVENGYIDMNKMNELYERQYM